MVESPRQRRLSLLALGLVLCILLGAAGLFLGPGRFGARANVGAMPVASPTTATLSPPDTIPTQTGVAGSEDRAARERLQAERDRLRQSNSELQKAAGEAEAEKKKSLRGAKAMAALNEKMLDSQLKVPRTLQEAGALMGRSVAAEARFKAKWGDDVPADGTPEAAQFASESDALLTQTAELMKFMAADERSGKFGSNPADLAQFQSLSLVGAIGLREDQIPGIDAALTGYYQQFFSQNLNSDARPETGVDAWHNQQIDLSKQAFGDIVDRLTPDQAAAFKEIYGNGGWWLWHIRFGVFPQISCSL